MTDLEVQLLHERIAELEAENKKLRTTNHQLTEFKTDGILAQGYVLTGYVMAKPENDNERCIVELSAVRWLKNEDMWDLMHPHEFPQKLPLPMMSEWDLIGWTDNMFKTAPRVELVHYAQELEKYTRKLQDERTHFKARYENSNSLAQGFAHGRMAICKELMRFGMILGGDNKITCKGPQTYVNPNTNQVHMVPIMASGLEPPPIKPFSNELKPIISWFRVIKEKGETREEFSHYEDAKLDTGPSKNSGRPKVAKKGQPLKPILPAPDALPTQVHPDVKFTGKWVWKLQYRTDELCPKIVEKK